MKAPTWAVQKGSRRGKKFMEITCFFVDGKGKRAALFPRGLVQSWNVLPPYSA
jgi:hypothetical protein